MAVPATLRAFPAGGRGGREQVMAGVAVRESVTVAGLAGRARVARAFAGAVLGPGHPCRDDAALLVGELFGNSIRHSGSGAPGQTVTVAVVARDGVVRVEVADRTGTGVPELRPADGEAEGGRGLQLVERLSTRWGWRRDSGQTVTWFELRHGWPPTGTPTRRSKSSRTLSAMEDARVGSTTVRPSQAARRCIFMSSPAATTTPAYSPITSSGEASGRGCGSWAASSLSQP
jgi:anti-sigma regulatory factor (Ser/Thr protein kinase)